MGHDWSSILVAWDLKHSKGESAAKRDGATALQLELTEHRLGMPLPPSYRAFLETTNGYMTGGDAVYELWPAERIGWFRTLNSQWVMAYTGPVLPAYPTVPDSEYFIYGAGQDCARFRVEYLPTALQISPEGDSAVYLLNPKVIDAEGEWEAWLFANWLPGATRYRSFWDMIMDEYELG